MKKQPSVNGRTGKGLDLKNDNYASLLHINKGNSKSRFSQQTGGYPTVTALLNYYKINGGFGESLCPTILFINLWQANDKRKDISVQCCGQWKNPTTGAVTIFSAQTSQSYTMKYIIAVATQNDSKANWKVIRYADVLLMYAEALNENGKTAAALTPLNQIRTRAGLSTFSTLTQADARDSIALERRFELCAPVGMKDYMTVFPVPLSQVRVMNNPTIFPQNNGYN